MRILVTGGSGFIGRFLVPHLLASTGSAPEAATGSTAVTLLLRQPLSPPSLTPFRSLFNVVYADLRDFSQTERALRQAAPDVVIHLAAAGATDPFLAVETAVSHNLLATTNLLRACFEKGGAVQQCIVARTPGERSSMNVYAASKAAAWEFCRLYARTQGWPIHGAMIFQAYGPGQPAHAFMPAALRAASAGEDFPMTEGSQIRDWIHGEDVAAGVVGMVERPLAPGTTVELGTGSGTSLAEVAHLIYQTINRGGRPLPGRLPNRPGEAPSQIADAAHTEALIGWQAAIPLAEGIRQLVNG